MEQKIDERLQKAAEMRRGMTDKDKIRALIERRKTAWLYGVSVEAKYKWEECKDILEFIDSLEVKEVDLEKEYKDFIKCDNGRSMFETAKHFFELGLSVNNPITAADRGTAEEIIINLKRVEQDYRIDLTKEIGWVRNKVKKGE